MPDIFGVIWQYAAEGDVVDVWLNKEERVVAVQVDDDTEVTESKISLRFPVAELEQQGNWEFLFLMEAFDRFTMLHFTTHPDEGLRRRIPTRSQLHVAARDRQGVLCSAQSPYDEGSDVEASLIVADAVSLLKSAGPIAHSL